MFWECGAKNQKKSMEQATLYQRIIKTLTPKLKFFSHNKGK